MTQVHNFISYFTLTHNTWLHVSKIPDNATRFIQIRFHLNLVKIWLLLLDPRYRPSSVFPQEESKIPADEWSKKINGPRFGILLLGTNVLHRVHKKSVTLCTLP